MITLFGELGPQKNNLRSLELEVLQNCKISLCVFCSKINHGDIFSLPPTSSRWGFGHFKHLSYI